MTGTTGLKDLRVDCIVGIYPHERAATQTVMLDIELDYDFAAPAASDAIADAVDYDGVAAGVTGLLQARQFQLIETMAEQAAALLLTQVPVATAVRIEVRKPAAVPAAACSFVRVERRR
ncbi:MAG: dihydroneopterin aldolase [Acidobacteria bacterium]|nr:dihydroneopterin aldolase [Acidobacteriota bacterium]MCC6987969.1 dihydroneopterin aldolase [Acidobacteriota bacterium]